MPRTATRSSGRWKPSEAMSETRRNRAGKDVIGVDGLIWSSHHHYASRPTKRPGRWARTSTPTTCSTTFLGQRRQEASLC
jgi:hypothetical protein